MSSRNEIERAIEQLPAAEVEQIFIWLQQKRAHAEPSPVAMAWLKQARGAAAPGVTTADIMAMTREG